jgi:endoglucanase
VRHHRSWRVIGLAALVAATTLAPGVAQAAQTPPAPDHTLATNTRFFVPPPADGSVQQIAQLAKSGDVKDAALLAEMEATPAAVWLTGGTPQQVAQQVRTTLFEAALEHAEPEFVLYDIPGRDCSQYSAGGALDTADYEAWVAAVAQAVGSTHAVMLVEPDSLGNMPSDCGLATSTYPFTNAERFTEVGYAVSALEKDPDTSVYLDGTNSHWQQVGNMSSRLLQADVADAQGFFLNVSNYQTNAASEDYGNWVSDCIAMISDPSDWAYNLPADCASQYYPASVDDFSTWALTNAWYAQNMGGAVATAHYVIDTSRNGQGANTMGSYADAPYNQPASVISTLDAGNWCNPTGAGLGLRPTANTGVPLLDAFLWVKTPGESDGQCDAAGGVRAWDYTAYSQPGWPTDATAQNLFDPLWGIDDPAAGSWFSQQALQLVQNANPPLPGIPALTGKS